MPNRKTEFGFGQNQSDQIELFGGVPAVGPQAPPAVDGANPITPLQISVKTIRLERISMALADSYSIEKHYLHRTAKNSKIALGIFAQGELHGVMIWGLPVAKMKGQYGKKFTRLELRRMYCDEFLPKNTESRCLAISAKILKGLFPQVRLLVAYSDLSKGHKGGIYKAAGWIFDGICYADPEGSWSKHERHNRVEFGDKYKWVKTL